MRSLGEAVGLSRSTIFRHLHAPSSSWSRNHDVELRGQIQSIALEMRSYGYRPITKELHRRGVNANHKRVLRLLREDNLLCLRQRAFVRTTDSNHALTVYPNLARGLALSNINQLWVADITYIRLRREFVYLAVVLDAYSRRCIGWALSRHIDTELALKALRMALETRTVPLGLVHHSDRGVQYAAGDYVALLQNHKIRISMSRTGNPYDNAKAERFMRTRSPRSWPRSSISSKRSIIGSDFTRPSATCRQSSLKLRFHHHYFLNFLCHFRGALRSI